VDISSTYNETPSLSSLFGFDLHQNETFIAVSDNFYHLFEEYSCGRDLERPLSIVATQRKTCAGDKHHGEGDTCQTGIVRAREKGP
jgi:hypothetical protein